MYFERRVKIFPNMTFSECSLYAHDVAMCNARRGPYVAYQIKTAVYEPTARYVAFYLTFHMTSLRTFYILKKDANNDDSLCLLMGRSSFAHLQKDGQQHSIPVLYVSPSYLNMNIMLKDFMLFEMKVTKGTRVFRVCCCVGFQIKLNCRACNYLKQHYTASHLTGTCVQKCKPRNLYAEQHILSI